MRTTIAIALTLILIGGCAYLLTLRSEEVSELKLNEIGDFVAGIGSLIALLWLVIGYFQQGQELRQNTEALNAQQEELRRQAEETARLVQFSRDQATAMKALAQATKDALRHDQTLTRATEKQAQATEKLVRAIESIKTKLR